MAIIPMAGYAIVNLLALVLEGIWIVLGKPWKNSFMHGMSRSELNGRATPKSTSGKGLTN
jgi:hypothetical protein